MAAAGKFFQTLSSWTKRVHEVAVLQHRQSVGVCYDTQGYSTVGGDTLSLTSCSASDEISLIKCSSAFHPYIEK